jgi:hypothetical protein
LLVEVAVVQRLVQLLLRASVVEVREVFWVALQHPRLRWVSLLVPVGLRTRKAKIPPRLDSLLKVAAKVAMNLIMPPRWVATVVLEVEVTAGTAKLQAVRELRARETMAA